MDEIIKLLKQRLNALEKEVERRKQDISYYTKELDKAISDRKEVDEALRTLLNMNKK